MSTMRHFVLKVEARKLYRDTLRVLKGVEPSAAAGVREAARAQFAEHAHETDIQRIRVLLLDGQHSLKQVSALALGDYDRVRRSRR